MEAELKFALIGLENVQTVQLLYFLDSGLGRATEKGREEIEGLAQCPPS